LLRATAEESRAVMSGAIGMMNEGYFVGRKELINWIRQNFDSGFNKIEDLASGVVYCQIVDSIYPGVVPMSKVKMSARTEVDFIHNFKVYHHVMLPPHTSRTLPAGSARTSPMDS